MAGSRGWLFVAGAILFRSLAAVGAKAAAVTGATIILSLINPWYGAALCFFFFQALCWTTALRRLPLTVAYPFMSLVFALNLAAAHYIFGERVAFGHVAGVGLIILGVSLINRGEATP